MSYHSPRQSHNFYDFNPSTPPPPPPKPSHPSRTATPRTGPPLPPAQGQPLQLHSNHHQASTQPYTSTPSAAGPGQSVIEPPDDGWLPDVLKDKSTVDLHHVLHAPELQHAIIHNPETAHPSIPASTAPLQALLAQNVALAESLKQLEAHLQHQRESTQSRLLSLRALERQWRAKQAEQDEALREFSPPALYQRLSAAVGEQEALCRGLEESFLEGEIATRGSKSGLLTRRAEREVGRGQSRWLAMTSRHHSLCNLRLAVGTATGRLCNGGTSACTLLPTRNTLSLGAVKRLCDMSMWFQRTLSA